jgi:hypothetical protein
LIKSKREKPDLRPQEGKNQPVSILSEMQNARLLQKALLFTEIL